MLFLPIFSSATFLFPGRVIYPLQTENASTGLKTPFLVSKLEACQPQTTKRADKPSCKPLKPNNHEKTCLQRYCIVSVAAKSSIRSHLQGIPIFLFFLFFL